MEGIRCQKILDSKQFVRDAVVVPPNMRKSVFTTADVDNINEIVRSNLQQNDLNGTKLSFTNHLTSDNERLRREPKTLSNRSWISVWSKENSPSGFVYHCATHRITKCWYLSRTIRWKVYSWINLCSRSTCERWGLTKTRFCFDQQRYIVKGRNVLISRVQCESHQRDWNRDMTNISW